ncbi:MAG: AAA family ATPase [Deltaproteobacteria bacterium]|nr:AAA family ATPase [Deltaproteobacteria bacterium]
MYEEYWGLNGLPFQILPDAGFYYPTKMHEEAIKRILYAIKTSKGSFLLTGDIGAGKTIVVSLITETLFKEREKYEVALINHPTLDCNSFIKEILHQFGIRGDFAEKTDMIHTFHEWLLSSHTRGKYAVLIIDEAHLIKDMDIFEEIRLFSDFHVNNRPLLTLVLAGQSEIRKTIQNIRPLDARIAIKYHIFPLSMEETTEYIKHRLEAAGGDLKIFTDNAVADIYRFSGGLPREINKICDMCLFETYLLKKKQVDSDIVQKVGSEEFIV